MTHHLLMLVALWGPSLVFASVLLEQLGLPLPAMPTLLVAGALVSRDRLALGDVLGLALLACLVGDSLWFWAGRHFGPRVDLLLRRNSSHMAPHRHGAGLLLVAKFVPGLSTLAPPMAGANGLRWSTFVLLDLAGSLLWAGSALTVGYACAPQIDTVLNALRSAGQVTAPACAGLLATATAMYGWQHYARRRRTTSRAILPASGDGASTPCTARGC